ncbi:alpha-tocopherol transfer protein-like [Chironomus tepperi]|uniref:alpha-tocopherol transfer protein-like n=1 Tax=Chironomus tepperi TaxID=113505 RepID=UPI00391FBAAA
MSTSETSIDKVFKEHHESLEKLKEWISNQDHIPKNIPRPILLRYLKVCNFDLEEAKKLLDINVKFRIKHQYLFADRDIDSEEFHKVSNTVQFMALPKKTKDGCTVEVYRLVDPSLDYFSLKDLFKSVFMIHDLTSLKEPNTNGLIAIFDAKNFSIWHFMKMVSHAPTVINFLQYVQEADCIDIRQIHYVNCSSIVSKVQRFIKPFITRELSEIMHFHSSNYDGLHEYVSKDCLPVDFGGCEGTLDEYMEDTLSNLRKHRDFITNNDNFFLLKQ